MNNINSDYNNIENQESFDFTKEALRYLFFWKYFVLSILLFLFMAFIYNRYTPKMFDTNAKIQILDKKQTNLEMPSAEDLFSSSKINLENEMEVIMSSSILHEVIDSLNLKLYVEEVGQVMESRVVTYPFDLKTKFNSDSVYTFSFNISFRDNELIIFDLNNNNEFVFNDFKANYLNIEGLPFIITNINKVEFSGKSFNIKYTNSFDIIKELKQNIIVSQIGKKSDIINLKYIHSNSEYARNVLNEIIDVFNNDGVRDRQLIHKRTIDFVNARYSFLASELESIEIKKQLFKVENNLIDLSINSNISLNKSSVSEENIFFNENQIFLVSNLLNELEKIDFELLPSNIGIENLEVNSLIFSYNDLVLEKRKLITSAGPNNPYIKQINNSINDLRANIISSLKNYLMQLNVLRDKLSDKSNSIQDNVSNIPAQEKNLRAIERNQQIKESLYLFLLQKGEEAQVSYAVTEPSIKVVEYAISNRDPLYPKARISYIIALFIGLLLPTIIIYIIFSFDTKIYLREDLEKYNFNVIGEIPFFNSSEEEKIFINPEDRSIISESFRMLMSNVRYLENNNSKSNVLLVTSSIKGEGKTLNALNLALTFSSVGKKVLLIGCDLRNPQLHKYAKVDKNTSGLVDFLIDNKTNWKKNIIKPFENQPLDIILSGPIPPNPLNLINNGNIDLLIKDASKFYEYIIIDSAPTLLVADTKSLINKADIIVYLTRTNVTEKEVLTHISKLSKETSASVGVILNGAGAKNSYGYSYGYQYGYSYNYAYNYGYGYGYSSEDQKS